MQKNVRSEEETVVETPDAASDQPLQLALNEADTPVGDAPPLSDEDYVKTQDPAPTSGVEGGTTAATAAPEWLFPGALLGGLGLGGLGFGLLGGGSGSASSAAVSITLTGTVVARPLVAGHGLKVAVYKADGITKLGEAVLDAHGKFTLNIGSYTGELSGFAPTKAPSMLNCLSNC